MVFMPCRRQLWKMSAILCVCPLSLLLSRRKAQFVLCNPKEIRLKISEWPLMMAILSSSIVLNVASMLPLKCSALLKRLAYSADISISFAKFSVDKTVGVPPPMSNPRKIVFPVADCSANARMSPSTISRYWRSMDSDVFLYLMYSQYLHRLWQKGM